MADTVAQPRARKIVRLREGAHNEQIVVFLCQRHAGGIGACKCNVGFIHNDNVPGIAAHDLLNGIARCKQAGRCVGVRNDDGLVKTAVFGKVNGKIIFERQNVRGDMQQITQNRVKAVGNIRKRERVAFVTERPQREQQVLVTAVAAQDVFRRDAAVAGNGRTE